MSNQRGRPISDELRRLVMEHMERTGTTRYRVARDAGLKFPTLYQWLKDSGSHGTGETLDRIAAYLGAKVGVPRKKPQKNMETEATTE